MKTEIKDVTWWTVSADHNATVKNPYDGTPSNVANNKNYHRFARENATHFYAVDEMLKPGDYPAGMFGEVVKQEYHHLLKRWLPFGTIGDPNDMQFETRLYLPLKEPVPFENDPRNYVPKDEYDPAESITVKREWVRLPMDKRTFDALDPIRFLTGEKLGDIRNVNLNIPKESENEYAIKKDEIVYQREGTTMPIYVVTCESGDHEDYRKWNIKAFHIKYEAELYVAKANMIFEKVTNFYRERYDYTNKNKLIDQRLIFYNKWGYFGDQKFDFEEITLL